ncbi:MAG: nucleotidyltransferase family protein [Defluviicoccus sp.]|nr:nucleotidyltransferase family protein [Defluviicoccus sp.]MDS4073635.1 nucleotidyltransferase family protein [Defluviicoccus sp.]
MAALRVGAALKVGAIVLAAGRSTRLKDANKLLAAVGGQAIIARVVEAALASQAAGVHVVVAHESARIVAALAGRAVAFVAAPEGCGIGVSIGAGIRALEATAADGALIILGDMPFVESSHLDRLIAAFTASGGSALCVPTHAGRRGNPRLWPRGSFPQLMRLEGDVGGRDLLASGAFNVLEVAMDDDAVLRDIDTAADLAALRGARATAGRV